MLERRAFLSHEDDIDYDGSRYDGPRGHQGPLAAPGRQVPEVVTLAYSWDAYDYESRQRRTLYKPIGGFWVGCSIEGLLAARDGPILRAWPGRDHDKRRAL